MATFQFSEEENTVVLDGSRYRAEEGLPGECTGCAMKKGFGCRLCEAVYQAKMYAKIAARCMATERKDGRSIVWKLDV